MTLEEQRDYWEERYNIEVKKSKELEDNLYEANNIINNYIDSRRETKERLEALIKEMNKNGSMYWAGRIKSIID